MTLFCGYEHSSTYATFRPVYPHSLFKGLAAISPSNGLAWDVACGTGQATSAMASMFDQVIGTDLAQSQLDHAIKRDNIFYAQCSAEEDHEAIAKKLNIKTGSVDLISVAQALHWFNFDKFYSNVKHFLKPDGVLAVWTYTWPEIVESPELTCLLRRMANEILGPYWAPERKIVDNQYRDVPFPFEKIIEAIEEPYTFIEAKWNLQSMLGYIRSWSAYQTYLKVKSSDPLDLIQHDIIQAWKTETQYTVHFPVFLLAGRNSC